MLSKITATLLSIAAIAILSVRSASAEVGTFFVQGSAGLMMPNDLTANGPGTSAHVSLDKGVDLTAAFGYFLPFNILRIDAEVGFAHTGFNSGTVSGVGSVPISNSDVNILTIMGDVYYDIETGTIFRPYVGGGLGFAHQDAGNATIGATPVSFGSSDDFAWQAEVGVSIELSPNLDLIPSYRYRQINNGKTVNGIGIDNMSAHVVKIGLRYMF